MASCFVRVAAPSYFAWPLTYADSLSGMSRESTCAMVLGGSADVLTPNTLAKLAKLNVGVLSPSSSGGLQDSIRRFASRQSLIGFGDNISNGRCRGSRCMSSVSFCIGQRNCCR